MRNDGIFDIKDFDKLLPDIVIETEDGLVFLDTLSLRFPWCIRVGGICQNVNTSLIQ